MGMVVKTALGVLLALVLFVVGLGVLDAVTWESRCRASGGYVIERVTLNGGLEKVCG